MYEVILVNKKLMFRPLISKIFLWDFHSVCNTERRTTSGKMVKNGSNNLAEKIRQISWGGKNEAREIISNEPEHDVILRHTIY